MKKLHIHSKTYWTLAIILLVISLSTVTLNSIYRADKQVASTNEPRLEETSTTVEPAVPAINADNNSTPPEVQALPAVIPKKTAPAAPKPVAKATNNTNTVSRSSTTTTAPQTGQSTNTYKYPLLSKVNGSFGQFHYRDLSDARIEIDPNWIAQNIVTITLPGLNQKVQVHKNAAANFIQAFTYIKNGTATINGKQVPLLSLINTMDGTFVTRHVNWNPANGLSNHSWGTAMDINADDHYVGLRIDPNSTTDPNAILWRKAFQPAGFSWGNRYNSGPDSMHYELIK